MILIRIALRNLRGHWVKGLIVGGLLFLGAALVVVGLSLLSTIDRSMAKSIVGSVSGNLQVYAKDAKDKLTLFAGMTDGTEIGHVEDFAKVRQTLEAVPGVKAVIPMGTDVAMVYGGNVLDVKLDQLRAAEKGKDKDKSKVVRAHVRKMVGLLAKDLDRMSDLRAVKNMSDETKQAIADVKQGGSDAFWASFDKDPFTALEFLENKVAPLGLNADMIWFRYIGTDLDRFASNFELFEVVDGTQVPKGQRGFLFNKLTYEETIKHRTARRFDKIRDRLAEGFTLKRDEDLQQWRKLNKDQMREITYQLDDRTEPMVRQFLQKHLDNSASAIEVLLAQFMDINDDNFGARYTAFYAGIAPHLMLYSVKIGDVMTMKGFTSAGYPTTVNVKVYGTFRFKSLDKSMMAGGMNLIDLMSYRDLYGFLTADRKEELAKLQAQSGVKPPSHDRAEADLFADADDEVEELPRAATVVAANEVGKTNSEWPAAVAAAPAVESGFDEFAKVDMKASAKKYGEDLFGRVYAQPDIDGGVVRNAAILLHNGIDERQAKLAVQKACNDHKLGLQVMDWREASGMIGQFLFVIYAVLAGSLFIIFFTAMVIINNSTVLATMERTREIGALRAIGAQRSYIRKMFFVEGLVLALLFGSLGSAFGGLVVAFFNAKGIAAFNDVFVFLFAGPRLYPTMSFTHVVVALVVVTVVTLFSTLYPAWLATRVTPLQAMQDAE
ncbi:MAG: FtsX-like permease family protein [Myxococcales bacterium]|nr:FtsX-like permease family protein [Myxococcales bacterium]